MKLTHEQIQAKLDSFNKAYKENGWTDGKISKLAAYDAAQKAGVYKKTEQYRKTMIQKYGSVTGAMSTQEVKAKRKETLTKKYGNSTGHMNTVEAKAKTRDIRIKQYGGPGGHLQAPENIAKRKKSILQYDKQGNFIKQWAGLKDASIELKISIGAISACANKKSKTAGGFIWKYKLD